MRFSASTMSILLIPMLALSLALASCKDDGPTPPTKVDVPAAADPLPAGFMLSVAPAGARDVAAVKAGAKEGDVVVIRGRIGTAEPFVAGRAAMTIVDPVMVPCNEMAMEDGCPTPWDYCCADPAELRKSEATIQFADASGQPVRHDFRLDDLTPLSYVIVTGKVGPRPDPKVLIVNATGIFVEKKVVAAVAK